MHEKIKKVISILIVFFLATMIFSTTISAKWFNSETTLKEKIERLNQKTNDLINQLSEQQSKDSSKETNKFLANRQPTTSLIKTLQSYTALRANDPTLRFYTNYNGQEKETRLKLFFETKIDVDGENGNDIGVRYTILPGIARPLSLSINFKLTIRQLTGFNQLDENAFFEGYAELYFPGILVKNLSGYRVRFGYQSPEGEKTPEKCDVIFKFIPNLIYPRKKAGFHFAMIPDAATTGKEKLNLLSGLAEMNGDTVVSEVYSKTLYNPAVETEISLSRSKSLGKRIFEFERQRSGDSQVDMYIAITEGANSTYAYVKEVPELVTLSSKSGRNGFIEFDAHGKAVDEIGVCDDFENPINKAYFSNMFTKAKIEWNRDRLFLLKKGKANVSIYTEGEGVSFNVHLEDEGNGSLDFSALSEDAIIDVFMELDLSEGYFSLKHSMYNISLSLLGNGPDNGVLDASLTLKKTEDKPFEIYFNGLKEGNAEILLAGKSFEIYNLDIKMISYLPSFNGEYSITMDHLEKTKEGSIGSSLSIVKEDKNVSGYCRFDIVHGVKITNLSLKFNNFEFKRTNIDETGTITKWYNFTLNITDVEWHDHDDWGYILIKGDNSAFFSFDSKYWDNEELVGIISGSIQLKTLGDVFNISWDTVDGNKTYYFDGTGVIGLYDFHLWMKDKIDVSIPEISGSFDINTNEKSGELILYFDGSSSMLEVDIEDINVTDLFDIILHGSIDIDIAGSTSGTIGIGWNETGTYFFDTNFGMDITGSINITDFLFAYQENLINISLKELVISGNLNLDIISDDEGISISGDSDLTNIVISDLSIYLSLSKPLQVSLDVDITFDGNGDITAKYVNDTILLNGEVSGDSEILVNSFWFLVPIPSLPIEINLENLQITGLTTIVFDVNTSQTTPFMITIYADQEITADIIYLGMAPFLQIYVNDFVGGGTDGNLGIGWNTQTGQPVFNFDHSSCSIGVLHFIVMEIPIEISDISLDGTMEIEGFLDLGSFSFVYVYGTVYEDTTITLGNLNIPVIGLCDISIVLEPGKLDVLLQQNLVSGGDDAYIYGYSSGWITIRVNETELVKIMGTLDLWLHLHMGDDGIISAALDAKEVSGAVVIADTLRLIGEANAKLEFSVKIVEEDGTTTISDLYFNLTGEITAVVQIKTDESEWIPILPFSSSGQVVMFRQTGFMGTPNIVDDFEIVTPEDNASLIFEVWYAPPLGEDSDSIGPYTYNIDFGDGSTYELATDESRITVDSHLYDIGSHTASVTVTPTDTSYTPVDDSLSFTIIKRDITYMELVDNGPDSFTYADVGDDGRFHSWFIIRNVDEDDYTFNWESSILPWGMSFEGMDPIVEPISGILNPGESIKIDASFLPPPDHKEHIMSIWPGAENIDYTGSHPDEDGVGFPISIRQSLSLVPGSVYLPSLNPGEERTSSFWIWNNKDEALSWSLTDIPNIYFSFSSTSGTIPRFGAEIVHFTVSAPDEEGFDLGGDIEITDIDDPLNVATVPVNVKTKGSSSTNENVTITEDENGDVSIAIGGLTEIHIDHFQFEINGVSGELNGHFLFDTDDSYVFINFSKNDITTLSLDGNGEFSIENFHFVYGDNINIEISKVITGGFNFAQGKSGIFYLVVDDTFTDIDINLHLNHEFSNFTLVGNLDVDISSSLDGSLWIEWDLNGDIKNVNIDGDLFGYNYMEVSITDFNFTMNNFSFTADEIYFNRAVDISWNETDLYLESETIIQASNIHFVLNGDLDIIITSGNIEIDGSLLFQFRIYDDHFRLYIFTTGLSLNGQIHVYFGDYYGYCTIFFTIVGEIWIEVYLD